jgi:hypothetical protein
MPARHAGGLYWRSWRGNRAGGLIEKLYRLAQAFRGGLLRSSCALVSLGFRLVILLMPLRPPAEGCYGKVRNQVALVVTRIGLSI